MTAEAKPVTVYEIMSDGVELGDTRFHRNMSASWLKEYTKNALDWADLSDEDWDNYAQSCRDSVTRKKRDAIEAAVRVLDDSVNGPDKDLVVASMANMHKTLLDSLATCVMNAINATRRTPTSEFDGRIGTHFQNFIKEYFIHPGG